jgi:DNA-binding LacI/PurR family transcriptional regulator
VRQPPRITILDVAGLKFGFEVREVIVPGPVFEAAFSLVERVVGTGASAVVAFNEQMALGVIAGRHHLGASVPVGFDDVPTEAMVAPSGTVSMPTDEAVSLAVEMLGEGPVTKELFRTFVVRHSSGPVSPGRASVQIVSGEHRVPIAREDALLVATDRHEGGLCGEIGPSP